MGEFKHNAIVVTTCRSGGYAFIKAKEKAIELFGIKRVSNVAESDWNGYRTFMVAPDGSKERWEESEIEDKKRKQYAKYIESFRFEDGSSPLDYIDVAYGSLYLDENKIEIIL